MDRPGPAVECLLGVLQDFRIPRGALPSRASGLSSSPGSSVSPAVILLTLSGQWTAENRAAQHMRVWPRSPHRVQSPLALPPVLKDLCATIRRLGKARSSDSELLTVRRIDAIEGRDVLVTGVLLPARLSEEPRHVLVTIEWAGTAQRDDRSPPSRPWGISRREHEVVRCLSQGMTNKEIAVHLGISQETVKEYLKRIMQKTRCRTRAGILGRVMHAAHRLFERS